MSGPTDVEISRAINALSTTLNDQRPAELDRARLQAIVDGAVANEPLFVVSGVERDRAALLRREDNTTLAHVRLDGARWVVERVVSSLGSGWARPSS
jgi:hypothetical protein